MSPPQHLLALVRARAERARALWSRARARTWADSRLTMPAPFGGPRPPNIVRALTRALLGGCPHAEIALASPVLRSNYTVSHA